MIESFAIFEGPNLGGISGFVFVPAADIESMPPEWSLTIQQSDIQLKAGRQWFSGYATMQTLGFTENMQRDAQGERFAQQLRGIYPKALPQMSALFKRMQGKRFVLIANDNNGKARVIGHKDAGLRFSATFTINPEVGSRTAYAFTFERESVWPAPFSDFVRVGNSTGPAECTPVLIKNQNNQIIASVPSGASYSVIEISGIRDDASFNYQNSVIATV